MHAWGEMDWVGWLDTRLAAAKLRAHHSSLSKGPLLIQHMFHHPSIPDSTPTTQQQELETAMTGELLGKIDKLNQQVATLHQAAADQQQHAAAELTAEREAATRAAKAATERAARLAVQEAAKAAQVTELTA